MERLRPIALLLILTCFFTFFLFGFTIYHKEKIKDAESQIRQQQTPEWACGTQSYTISNWELADTGQLAHVRSGEAVFNANCKACHRIKHKLVGPALEGVFERRDSVWIRTLITNIDILIKRKDKEVPAIRKEYNYTQHTHFERMAKKDMDDLLEYLKVAR